MYEPERYAAARACCAREPHCAAVHVRASAIAAVRRATAACSDL